LVDMLWKSKANDMYGYILDLIDPDVLERSNLTRHILGEESLGLSKATEMARLYSGAVHGYQEKFGEHEYLTEPAPWDMCSRAAKQFRESKKFFSERPDIIACCADSDACCQLVNQYAVDYKIPVVFAGVHGAAETAEIITYIPGKTPCYACYDREGPEPEPSQEKYTNPDYDSTKMPSQPGLWGDVLMAASLQFQAILGILGVREQMPPLVLMGLRYPFKTEFINQKERCAVCSNDFSKLHE